MGLTHAVRRVLALTLIGTLGIVGLATAGAVAKGTYSGASTLHLDGATATHPFAVVVKGAKIAELTVFAGGSCGDLSTSPKPLKVDIPIVHGAFNTTLMVGGKGFDDVLTLKGKFSGKSVSGSFTGTLAFSATKKECAVPKNTFRATLS